VAHHQPPPAYDGDRARRRHLAANVMLVLLAMLFLGALVAYVVMG
jgi:hypothetical protein